MISHETLLIDWISRVCSDNNNADRILVEKVVRVLMLLEGLVESGLSFVFKGGTAVMLLQGVPKRFSIDADIMVSDKNDFESLFSDLVIKKGFTRYELQLRKASSAIEKYHYKFYYQPVLKGRAEEEYVMLDILIENPRYKTILDVEIDSPFVLQDGEPLTVKAPSYEGLLGDKLTAFAPNTTGVPYEKNGVSMSMEIIKQLYDIGNLFDGIKEVDIVADTFEIFAETELKYRDLHLSIDDVLDDIIHTALCISVRGRGGTGDFNALQQGILRIRSYIFSERYHIEKAIVHAARAAYCAVLIKAGSSELQRFNKADDVVNWSIAMSLPPALNKLKKSNPEAFFYWYQAGKLNKDSGGDL